MAQFAAPHAGALPVRLATPWVVVAGGAAAGVAVGIAAALDADLLHFQPSALAVVGLIVGLAFGAALVWRPTLALIALILVVYLALSDVLIRWHGVPSLLQALAPALLLAGWRAQRGTGLPGPYPSALSAWLAAYALLVWSSTAWADNVALGDERAMAITKALVLYALVFLLAGSRERLHRAVWTFVAAAAFVAGLGVLQTLTGAYQESFGGLARAEYAQIYGQVFEPRIAGPVGDPNFFAQMLIPAVPLGLALFQGASSQVRRMAALLCVAIVIAATVLTYSRGGALALGVVLVLWLLFQGISRRRLAAGVATAAVVLALVPSDFTRRLTTFRQLLPESGDVLRLDSSFERRRVLATTAWLMFLDHPLTGVGAGNYMVHHYHYAEETSSVVLDYEESARAYPHNLYLEIAAETGLPGLLVFGTALLTCFIYLRRSRLRFRELGDQPSTFLAVGVQIALIGYLITSLFLHGHFARYLWLLFGFCAAVYRVTPLERQPWRRAAAPAGPVDVEGPGTKEPA